MDSKNPWDLNKFSYGTMRSKTLQTRHQIVFFSGDLLDMIHQISCSLHDDTVDGRNLAAAETCKTL